MHSHTQLAVVQEVLHWVSAGELVEDLWPVGDTTYRKVYRVDSAGDGGILDV